MKVYLKRRNTTVDAVGEYNFEDGTLVVLKGSRLSDDIANSPKFRGARSIEKAREGIVKDGILQKDAPFKSTSTAGNFVTGRSTNGLITWKDKDGRTLKEILAERSV